MKVIIDGNVKEIADLVLKIQDRQGGETVPDGRAMNYEEYLAYRNALQSRPTDRGALVEYRNTRNSEPPGVLGSKEELVPKDSDGEKTIVKITAISDGIQEAAVYCLKSEDWERIETMLMQE